MFGGHVNATTGGDVCVAGESCEAGKEGTANGEFSSWVYNKNNIAMGPGGAVYVGDGARIQVFESSGAWKENLYPSGLSSSGKVTALAVDAAGDVFVADEGVTGVREFEADGVEKATQFDAGSTTVEAIALDASGDLFVADSDGGFHVIEYDSSGAEQASFGENTAAAAGGMAFSDVLGELYVSSSTTIWILTAPLPGPLVEPGSGSAAPGERVRQHCKKPSTQRVTETTYRFEYGPTASYGSTTPAVALGSGFEYRPANTDLTGLIPGGTYHYRIVATNSQGTTDGPDEVFTTVAPPS